MVQFCYKGYFVGIESLSCHLLIATDGKGGHGLLQENIGLTFITKTNIMFSLMKFVSHILNNSIRAFSV